MKNQYINLFIDNRKQINKLPLSEQDCIKRLCRYLKAAPVSLSELEWMRKEFIGMAEEAKGRGENLSSTIGIREIEFCTELAKSCAKPSTAESVIYTACYSFIALLIAFVMLWALDGFPRTMTIYSSFLIYVILWHAYIIFSNNFFVRKTAYASSRKKSLFTVGYLAVCVPISLLSSRFVQNNANITNKLYVPGGISLLVLSLSAVISTLVLLYYLNHKLRIK